MPLLPWYGWYAIGAAVFGSLFYWLSFCDVDYLGLAYRGTPRWKAMRQASVVYGLLIGLSWVVYVGALLLCLLLSLVLPRRVEWIAKPLVIILDSYDRAYDFWEARRFRALSCGQAKLS